MMPMKHVLVPLDRSELAEAALDYAVDLVEPYGVLTLLTVIESPRYGRRDPYGPIDIRLSDVTLATNMMSYVPTEYEQVAWEQVRDYLDQAARRIQKPGLVVDSQIRGGNPAACILEMAQARRVDAIVMSTHGRSGLSRWMLGSVAQKVLCAASCPVFLVPQRAVEPVAS
jgi:nucleotide-binding universal stress UspA family protein